MPYKHTLSEVLVMLLTNPPEAIHIISVMAGGWPAERWRGRAARHQTHS